MSSGAARTQIPGAAADALRQQLRAVAEEEYLRLRTIDRPTLLLRSVAGAEDGEEGDVITAELEVVDERIAALDHFLHRTSTDLAAAGRILLVDRGDGPEYLLVSELPVIDERVVAADAPLGKALCDAVAGQSVTYVTPSGTCQAHVIATEPAGLEPALPTGAYAIPPVEVLAGFDGSPSSGTAERADCAELAHGRVVVGLHDSWHATDALAVGFAEAARRGAHLDVMVVRGTARSAEPLEPVFHAPDDEDRAEALHLPAAVAEVGQAYPGVPVRTSVRTGHFSTVLTELSNSVDLIVLGMGERSHGMGRGELRVASHSRCPVVLVRESSCRGES